MIVFNKTNGLIVGQLPDNQDINTFYYHFPEEFKLNLSSIDKSIKPDDLHKYKIVNSELVRLSDLEIAEMEKYGKILSEQERNDLVHDEVDKVSILEDRIKELEEIIDVILGGIDDVL